MKVEILVPVVIDVKGDGRCEALAPGKTLDFPKDIAEGLIAAGHAAKPDAIERAVAPAQR